MKKKLQESRNYHSSDVNCLTALIVLISNARRRIVEIGAVYSFITVSLLDTLKLRVENASKDYLGQDVFSELRHLTFDVNNEFGKLLSLLVTLHKNMERGYRKNKDLLLTNFTRLGFSAHWHEVSVLHNQNQMTEMLRKFDENMTPSLETQLYSHNVKPGIVEEIRALIPTYIAANEAQESEKPVTKELTKEGIVVFNDIYDDVMDIAVNCWDLYKKDPILRQEYSFRYIVSRMGNFHSRDTQPPVPPVI